MPRELGQAKRADLTGHFVGEPSEQVSSLTRFLVAAAQLQPPPEDAGGGNGRPGTDTEVAGHQTAAPPRHHDTEVAPHPRGGNGQARDTVHDTVFDSPLPTLDLSPEAMTPEPMEPELAPEPMGVAPVEAPPLGARTEMLRPPPVAAPAQPLAPAPLLASEPEALDSIPDFASPEHDAPAPEDEDAEPVTDKLPPRSLVSVTPLPDLPPPVSSADTGMLTMEAETISPADQLTVEELRADEDTHLQAGMDPSEKITSKVEPKRDIDPRSQDPNAVVRDTVNFYNQTQSLHGQRPTPKAGGETVAGTVPLAPRPREFEDSPSRRFVPPPPLPAAPSLDAESEELPLAPSMDEDLAPQSVTAPSLTADDEIEDANRKDTDRFLEDDRRPPDLPKPTGIDAAVSVKTRPAPGQVPPLDAVAPEKVAAGKDTQKFFVAEILAKRDAAPQPAPARMSSDSTGELQPETARELPPADGHDTAFEIGTERQATVSETKAAPVLPEATEVEKDFDTGYFGKPEERIIPEYDGVPDEAKGQPEEAEEAEETGDQPVERITEKVSKSAESAPKATPAPAAPARAAASGRPALPSSAGRMPVAAGASSATSQPRPLPVAAQRKPEPRVSDEVSRRLTAEREQTLQLLDAAEQLAARLRNASEQSRTDLLAISQRRRAAPLAEVTVPPEPAPDPVPDSQPTRILSARDYPVDEKPTTPVPPLAEADAVPPAAATSRARRERVPTQAISDIIGTIETKLGSGEPLSNLLQEASRRITSRIEQESGNGNGHHDQPDEDLDPLVAASASWRAVVGLDEAGESGDGSAAEREPAPPVVVARSPLADDLDRMWKELSTRKAAVVSSVEPARISRRLEAGTGWNQETLWATLGGIAMVTFVLGGLFVWIVYRLLA